MACPPYLSVIPQRSTNDCCVVCVAMLLGVTYEAALLAFGAEPLQGSRTREVRAAGKRLGVTLRWSRKFDLETDTGMLAMRSDKWHMDHVAVLREGLIIDTDASIWEVDTYLATHDATPMSLMTVD